MSSFLFVCLSRPVVSQALLSVLSCAAFFCPETTQAQSRRDAPVQVLTHHNDNARTGAILSETQLTVEEVGKPDRFGKLFSLSVDGQIHAQPLYLSDVTMSDNRKHNVVFVATAHDSVYAFDADNRDGANDKPLWRVSLLPNSDATPIPSADYDFSLLFGLFSQCYRDLTPEIGIISTPVIAPDGRTLYVVAATREKGCYVQRLHALDVQTGKEKPNSPVEIKGSVAGIGDSSVSGIVSFRPRQHLQRPALLWSKSVVYVAFGSHGDLPLNALDFSQAADLLPGYHGWIFAYDARTLDCLDIFNTTPNGGSNVIEMFARNEFAGGGIWMSGAGPAADEAGNLYFSTGNGAFTANEKNGTEYADSMVKLAFDPSRRKFQPSDFFTPSNQSFLENKDLDLGSCGVLLLPDEAGGQGHSHLLVGGGKEGNLYLVDREKMGHYDPKTNASVQYFLATYSTADTRKAQKTKFDKNIPRQPHHKTNQTPETRKLNALLSGRIKRSPGQPAMAKQTEPDIQISNIHSAPVYWRSPNGSLVYIWGEDDVLKAFHIVEGRFQSDLPHEPEKPDPQPAGQSQISVPPGMPGAMLSLSARNSDAGTGILWASHPYEADANHAVVPGILQAFDATPQDGNLRLLWTSKLDAADDAGNFAKFCPPTVANGKVYLATFSCQMEVYGLLSRREEIGPTEDSFVQAGRFAAQSLSQRTAGVRVTDKENAGAGRELRVARDRHNPQAVANCCAYLKFDLTEMKEAPKTALLTLNVFRFGPSEDDGTVCVYGLAEPKDQNWDFAHLTWNNAPGLQQADFSSLGEPITAHRVFVKKGSVAFDVTSFIAAHIGTVVTLQLLPKMPERDEKGHHAALKFVSRRDTGNHAQALRINFTKNPDKKYKTGEPLLVLTWY